MSGYTHGTPGKDAQRAFDAMMRRVSKPDPDPELDPVRGILDYSDIPSPRE